MKGQIANFCTPVRESLISAGYSYVRVLSAVNSYLGQLEAIETKSKVGNGRVTKTEFRISEVTTDRFVAGRSIVGTFIAWHSAVLKADKIAEMNSVALPTQFEVWLQKMKESCPSPTAEQAEPEPAEKD